MLEVSVLLAYNLCGYYRLIGYGLNADDALCADPVTDKGPLPSPGASRLRTLPWLMIRKEPVPDMTRGTLFYSKNTYIAQEELGYVQDGKTWQKHSKG